MRVGIIGFGSIAEHGHLPALQSFPGVAVTAVADLSPERLARAQELLPAAQLFSSSADLIDRADVDAVDICSPPHTHADLLIAACRRGIKDIVCEKPLVLSEDSYARVARARERSASRIISVNNWMHSDLYRLVKGVLREGMVGEVRSVVLRTGRTDIALGNGGWVPRWRSDPAYSGGGIILDHGWHQLYLLLGWIGQQPDSVRAVTRTVNPHHSPVEDDAVVDLHFPSATGRLELSWTAEGRNNDGWIEGTRGRIAIRDDRIVVHGAGGERELPFAGRLTQSSYHPDWFQKMFKLGILDKDRKEADRNFAEAGILVSIIGAAYRSARENGTPLRPISSSILAGAEAGNERVRSSGSAP